MDDGSGLRNWGGCYPPIKENLGLQLRSTTTERDTKHFIPGRNSTSMMVNSSGAYHHNQHHQHHNHRDYGLSEPQIPMEFDWITHSHRERYLQMLPINSNYIPETSGSHNHQLQILQQQPDSMKHDESLVRMEEVPNKGNGPLKKRLGGRTPKSPKPKKSKKDVLKDGSNSSVVRAKSMRKNMGVVINGIDIDLSGIPIPVCSCTGAPQQCYRWGCGGWQSACCTTSISMHPLPMSNKRRGARIAGRKMSLGAFKKVLEKLTSEGYNFSNPIDLRTHWAKHGTNKFVTIR